MKTFSLYNFAFYLKSLTSLELIFICGIKTWFKNFLFHWRLFGEVSLREYWDLSLSLNHRPRDHSLWGLACRGQLCPGGTALHAGPGQPETGQQASRNAQQADPSSQLWTPDFTELILMVLSQAFTTCYLGGIFWYPCLLMRWAYIISLLYFSCHLPVLRFFYNDTDDDKQKCFLCARLS